MKKNLIAIVFAAALILIAVFLYLNQAPASQDSSSNQAASKESVFTSIKDAMSKSLSLKCEYEAGEIKTIAYVKGNKVRVESRSDNEEIKNSNVIVKDNNVWMWTEGEDKGLLIELKDEEMESQEVGLPTDTNQQEIIEDLEAYKDRCETAVVSDSLFTPPSDVEFNSFLNQVQEEMMEGLQEMNITGVPLEVEE